MRGGWVLPEGFFGRGVQDEGFEGQRELCGAQGEG